ncbi:hypothetical protein DXG03_005367, partial [Asterophora parasitica]
IDVVNGLSLLTAKPVTYLVNLSERDYVRKKNKWLPKIKAWIDANNPGDPLIPFSVALEERLVVLSPEEKKEEETKVGATSALGKITQAGYSSLDVRTLPPLSCLCRCADFKCSSSATSRAVLTRCAHGRSGAVPRPLRPPVSSSMFFVIVRVSFGLMRWA